MKQYKAVSAPMSIQINNGNTNSAFAVFEDLINAEAAKGWEYHSMETITVTEAPGCGTLLQQQTVAKNYYMLIFVREA